VTTITETFVENTLTIDKEFLSRRMMKRKDDSHKGDYGHLLIIAGCERMPGAAVLATGAALKSGCGLVTLHSTGRALQATVNNFPSAMLSEDPGNSISILPAINKKRYSSVAVGPGLGKEPETRKALAELLSTASENMIPTVLDADALNILSESGNWMDSVPEGSILTPHLQELKRLFSSYRDDSNNDVIWDFCRQKGCILVKKGFHTRVFTPSGDCLENTTGNPGMAKGGSGDVLTGLIGGLLARGYSPADAAAIGIWIHGYAGDILSSSCTTEAYNSRDLIDCLWQGFNVLYTD